VLGFRWLHKGLRNLLSFIFQTIFCVGFQIKFVLSQGQTDGGQTLGERWASFQTSQVCPPWSKLGMIQAIC
jgi:hypothetical protein